MDYASTPDAIRAIVRTIENDVIPTITDSYASGQLWASTGLLGNIAAELDRAGVRGERDGVLAGSAEPKVHNVPADRDWATQAATITEQLTAVIAAHSPLHYRRAIAGFDTPTG